MRALFASTRGAGHVVPLVPFALALEAAGADVLVAAPRSAAPVVERAGLTLWAGDDPSEAPFEAIVATASEVGPAAAGVRIVREVFAGAHVRAALPSLEAVVTRWRPDVVLRETHELASSLVAERHGVPRVRVGIMRAAGETWAWPVAADALAGLRARMGLPPDPTGERLAAGPLVTLVPEALEDPAEPGRGAVHRFREPTREAVPLPDWWRGDDRPLVYATFGSEIPRTPLFPALYREVLTRLAALPVRVLATVGDGRDPADVGPLPENVHVKRWVAQDDVLPHAAAVVCHGGFGSVRAALGAAVPLVVVPFFADQPPNAARVAALGAGIALDGGLAAAPAVPEAVAQVLRDPGYRHGAARVAAEVAALPPVTDVPRLVGELLAA